MLRKTRLVTQMYSIGGAIRHKSTPQILRLKIFGIFNLNAEKLIYVAQLSAIQSSIFVENFSVNKESLTSEGVLDRNLEHC